MTMIDFSAQFGGHDAASAVLPYFKALKSASKGIHLEGFPFPKLAFILRVDGEVNQYGSSGIGNLDIGKKKGYLSIDIVITQDDINDIDSIIVKAFDESINFIENACQNKNINDFNRDSLKIALNSVYEKYISVRPEI